MIRPCLIPALCLLASGLLPLSAAGRTCRVLYLGAPKDAPVSLQLFDGKGSQEIELPRMNLSPIYELPSGAITLRLLEKAPEKPEDIPASAPKAAIAEGVADFYLFISHDPGNTVLPVSMRIIDANPDKLRNGQMLWFNLTGNRIAGKVGSRKIALGPNSSDLTDAPSHETGDYPVDIYYQMPGKKEAWPLCETKWLHNPAARIIMFVLPEEGSRVPRIMSVTDFREKVGGAQEL